MATLLASFANHVTTAAQVCKRVLCMSQCDCAVTLCPFAELYAHLNKEHYQCQLCTKSGVNPYRYYHNYVDLV